jgi:glycosyltransferase involved in cell wall biosynthesis
MRPSVVYWNNIPAPYLVDRLNAVADRGNIEIEAWFSERTHSERNWAVDETLWRFPHRYLPRIGIGTWRVSIPTPLLSSRLPALLVSLYADPAFILGTRLARWRHVRTAFWAEITFDAWNQRRPWKESLKHRLFSDVDGVIVAGRDGRRFARRYGALDERIHYVGQSIDVRHFSEGSALSDADRHAIRKQFRLKDVVFLYVGRLWRGKGLDTLFDAFAILRRSVSASLVLAGTGPESDRLKARCYHEGLDDIVFLDYWPDLPKVYGVADVFVFPTLGDPYGLVIDEAMASSMPIITTTSVGEVRDRIEDGVNGFVVRAGDSAALSDRMETLALNAELRTHMGIKSRERIADNTPNLWASRFESAIDRILSMPRTKS